VTTRADRSHAAKATGVRRIATAIELTVRIDLDARTHPL